MRKLLVYFSEVEPLTVNRINWQMQYNRNNQTYQMLIAICYLIMLLRRLFRLIMSYQAQERNNDSSDEEQTAFYKARYD